MNAPSPTGYVPLIPLVPAALGIYLELADKGVTDSLGVGFARLAGDSARTRVLRAALLSASGLVVARLVVKVAQDESAEGFFPEDEPEATNAAQDAWWARALGDLGRLQGAGRCFPDLVLPAPTTGALLPPLLFCTFTRRLFPIPCPTCLGPLRTCRDDALLVAAGLPLYSTGKERFLTCQKCRGEGGESRFFAPVTADAADLPPGVADLGAWQRGWAETVAHGHGEGPLDDAAQPCVQCAMAGSCLGSARDVSETAVRKKARAAGAQPLWSLFLAHDSPYIVTRLVPCTLDSFADRLGGRPAAETPGTSTESELLFGDDGSGLDAVEVLALKLRLFLQMLEAVREYHRRLGAPHLDLHPDHFLVDAGETGEQLPAVWSFRVKLLGTSGGRVVQLGPGVKTLLPPHEVKVPFAAPRVRDFNQQTRRRAELLVERAVAEPDGSGNWRLEGVLRDPHGLHVRPTSQDWLVVSFPDDAEELGVASATARLDPRRGTPAAGELHITSEPLPLLASTVRRVERSGGMRLSLVRYRVYPLFQDTDDAFSLGVILLRLLLVNDRQDLSAVAEVVAATVRRATSAALAPARSGAFVVESALDAALAAHSDVLARANLFYRQVDRHPDRPHALPESLWRAILTIAFRLLEMGLNPPPAQAPVEGTRLDAVIAENEAALRQVHSILFRRQGLNLEVQSLIEDLVANEPSRPQ